MSQVRGHVKHLSESVLRQNAPEAMSQKPKINMDMGSETVRLLCPNFSSEVVLAPTLRISPADEELSIEAKLIGTVSVAFPFTLKTNI